MEFRQHLMCRVYCLGLLLLGCICMALRAPAQDKFGPVMLSADVLEEEFRTNRIQITWNESLSVASMTLANFKVVLTASNVVVPITFGQYIADSPTRTILTMGTAGWYSRSNYYVLVNGIRDAANNVIAPNSVIGVKWTSLPTGPVPPSATPRLTIRRSGVNGHTISWPTNSYNYALEWSTNVTKVGQNSMPIDWCEVQPLMANPYSVTPQNDTHRIYRLRRTQ